jgi:DNA-directed RNA polymerase subunit RPC12/RpoP
VRVIGVASGFIFITGAIVAGVVEQTGPASIVQYALWSAAVGFVGIGTAGILVRYARCPSCGSIMKQGDRGDAAKFDGAFACAKCGKKWSTSENSRMHGGIG